MQQINRGKNTQKYISKTATKYKENKKLLNRQIKSTDRERINDITNTSVDNLYRHTNKYTYILI